MDDDITIDGVGPMPVVRPSSAAEVGDLVRRCAAEGTAVYPVGGGTMLDYGLPPARPGVAVELRALDKVIDFPARDMTITVEAGITIARLNEITQAEGLHLPIDVPEPERATLGGAIACNVSGPRRYGYGTFRDYVLGITTVNDRGELVSAGGRVVKNVAGYDLMKLHTGALGTLGIITQVTLKLRPFFEAWETVRVSLERNRLALFLDFMHQSETRPVMVNFRQVGLKPEHAHRFWIGTAIYEGSAEVVAWQAKRLRDEFSGQPVSSLEGSQGRGTELSPNANRLLSTHFLYRANLVPSRAAAFADFAFGLGHVSLWGEAGGAIIRGEYGLRDTETGKVQGHIKEALDHVTAVGGALIIERCDSKLKSSLPVWGRPPADLALQKAVKRALDPKNIFNPGRFVTDAF